MLFINHYEVLGLDPSQSQAEDIKKAPKNRKLTLTQWRQVEASKAILLDPETKAQFDKELAQHNELFNLAKGWLKEQTAESLFEDEAKKAQIKAMPCTVYTSLALNNPQFMKVFFPEFVQFLNVSDILVLNQSYESQTLPRSFKGEIIMTIPPDPNFGLIYNFYLTYASSAQREAYIAYRNIIENDHLLSAEQLMSYIKALGFELFHVLNSNELYALKRKDIPLSDIAKQLNQEEKYADQMLIYYSTKMINFSDDWYATFQVNTHLLPNYVTLNKIAQSYVRDHYSYNIYVKSLNFELLNEAAQNETIDFLFSPTNHYFNDSFELIKLIKQSEKLFLTLLHTKNKEANDFMTNMKTLEIYYSYEQYFWDDDKAIESVPANMQPYVSARVTLYDYRINPFIGDPSKTINFERYNDCMDYTPQHGGELFDIDTPHLDIRVKIDLLNKAIKMLDGDGIDEQDKTKAKTFINDNVVLIADDRVLSVEDKKRIIKNNQDFFKRVFFKNLSALQSLHTAADGAFQEIFTEKWNKKLKEYTEKSCITTNIFTTPSNSTTNTDKNTNSNLATNSGNSTNDSSKSSCSIQ